MAMAVAGLPLFRAYVTPEGIPVGRQEVALFAFLFFTVVLFDPRLALPRWRDVPTAPRRIFLVWAGWATVAATAADPSLLSALFRLAEWWLHALFALAVWAFVGAYPLWRQRIATLLVGGFLLYCAYLSYSHLFTEAFDPAHASNLTGFGFNNIRHFGYYGTAALVCALGLIMEARAERGRALTWFAFFSAAVAWAFLFWAAGRGPFFAVLLSAPVIIGLVRGEPWLRRFLALAALSATLGLLGSFLLPEILGGLARLFSKSVAEAAAALDGVSRGRLAIWTTCLGDIQAHPWFGVGPDNYRFNCGLVAPRTAQPHNILLQAALEWGIPGALLFFALLAATLSRAVARARTGARFAMLWCTLALLALSLVDGTLYHAFPTLLFFTALAVCLAPPAPNARVISLRERLRLGAAGSLAAYLILLF